MVEITVIVMVWFVCVCVRVCGGTHTFLVLFFPLLYAFVACTCFTIPLHWEPFFRITVSVSLPTLPVKPTSILCSLSSLSNHTVLC